MESTFYIVPLEKSKNKHNFCVTTLFLSTIHSSSFNDINTFFPVDK